MKWAKCGAGLIAAFTAGALLTAVLLLVPRNDGTEHQPVNKERVLIMDVGDEEVADKWLSADDGSELIGCIERGVVSNSKAKWIVGYGHVMTLKTDGPVRHFVFYLKDRKFIEFSDYSHKTYWRFGSSEDAAQADRILRKYAPAGVAEEDGGLGC